MEDLYYEKLFNIKTTGEQQGFYESHHYNRYEATSYLALETLFKEYCVNDKDSVVDFGCGKGRLPFYINYYYNSKVTGIEMNNNYFEICINNKKSYLKHHNKSRDKIEFINTFAEEYQISNSDNKFYFFNPFSVQLFIIIQLPLSCYFLVIFHIFHSSCPYILYICTFDFSDDNQIYLHKYL